MLDPFPILSQIRIHVPAILMHHEQKEEAATEKQITVPKPSPTRRPVVKEKKVTSSKFISVFT
jgi:hypothetical protein